MILDYTEEEHKEWKAIHDKYDLSEDFKTEEEFNAALTSALDDFKKRVEAERIAAIADNPQKILAAIKYQAEQVIETFVSGQIAAEYLNARVKAATKAVDERHEKAKNAKSPEEKERILRAPLNEGIISLKKIADRIRSKPLLEAKEARLLIDEEIGGLIAALEKYEERKQVEEIITRALKASPYVYFAPEEKKPTVEEIRLPLPRFETYGLMNDKLVAQLLQNEAFKQETNGQLAFFWNVDEAPAKKEPVFVSIALQYEGEETKLSRKMTAFDNEVYNAVSTIYFYHRQKNPGKPLLLTPQEIWRTMNGETDRSYSPSQKQIARTCNSMDKMRFTRVYIDITEEIKAQYITVDDERIQNGKIDTYLLKADKVTFQTDRGTILTGYKVDAEPILYTYNAAKKHILWVPFKLLDTSAETGNEGETIEIRGYLLRQIQLMKNGKRNSTRILYATIYEATAIPTPEQRIERSKYASENAYRTAVKKEAKKDRDKIAAILTAWVGQNHIKGFTPVKEGKSFAGVDIKI